MNISAAISSSAEILREAGVAEFRREASSLLAFVLQKDPTFLVAHPEYELTANHGQPAKYQHTLIGRNSRMDGIQAAVLSTKLPHLDGWLDARRRNAALYNEMLAGTGISLPTAPDHSTHTYHLYVIRVKDRDAVAAKLNGAGIDTGLHYPTALPYLDVYADFEYQPSDFPVAHSQMSELLSLPMYAELTDEMIGYVCEGLSGAISREAAAA